MDLSPKSLKIKLRTYIPGKSIDHELKFREDLLQAKLDHFHPTFKLDLCTYIFIFPSDLRIIQLSIEKQSLYTSDIEFPGKIKTYYMLDKKIIRQENVLVDYLCKPNICVLFFKKISSFRKKRLSSRGVFFYTQFSQCWKKTRVTAGSESTLFLFFVFFP